MNSVLPADDLMALYNSGPQMQPIVMPPVNIAPVLAAMAQQASVIQPISIPQPPAVQLPSDNSTTTVALALGALASMCFGIAGATGGPSGDVDSARAGKSDETADKPQTDSSQTQQPAPQAQNMTVTVQPQQPDPNQSTYTSPPPLDPLPSTTPPPVPEVNPTPLPTPVLNNPTEGPWPPIDAKHPDFDH